MLRVRVCPPASVRKARFAQVSACLKLRRATASANQRACRRRDHSTDHVNATKMIAPTSPINSRSNPRIIRIPSNISRIAPHLPLLPCRHLRRVASALGAGGALTPACHPRSPRHSDPCRPLAVPPLGSEPVSGLDAQAPLSGPRPGGDHWGRTCLAAGDLHTTARRCFNAQAASISWARRYPLPALVSRPR